MVTIRETFIANQGILSGLLTMDCTYSVVNLAFRHGAMLPIFFLSFLILTPLSLPVYTWKEACFPVAIMIALCTSLPPPSLPPPPPSLPPSSLLPSLSSPPFLLDPFFSPSLAYSIMTIPPSSSSLESLLLSSLSLLLLDSN